MFLNIKLKYVNGYIFTLHDFNLSQRDKQSITQHLIKSTKINTHFLGNSHNKTTTVVAAKSVILNL